MNIDKLNQWAKEIHDNATAHGWHEEKHSPEHLLSLIMCEVAEAVEADRENRYCGYVNLELLDHISDFDFWYRGVVKGTVEEEFADIVIRLLDMAVELHSKDDFFWCGSSYFRDNRDFASQAWYFVSVVLERGTMNISSSVMFIFDWAECLGIDLDQHIEWKMQYNKNRPYKHGGKKILSHETPLKYYKLWVYSKSNRKSSQQ